MTRDRILVPLLLAGILARDPVSAAQGAAPATPSGEGPLLAPATKSEDLKDQARRLVWDTRYDEAESAYRRVLDRDPLDAEAAAGLARVLARMHREPEAEHLVREVIARQPEAYEARLVLADILLSTERPEEALAELQRAASIDPVDPRSALGRGRALSACGRETEARAAYESTVSALGARLAAHPTDLEVRLARASALLRLGRAEEALAEYEESLRQDPRDREANLGCARALLRLDRTDQALAELDRFLADDSRVAEAHGLRGTAELRRGLPADAEPAFARAVEFDRWNPDYLVGIARARWARSDLAGARASCDEALALDATNPEVADLLARIDATPAPGDFRLFTGFRYDRLSGDRGDWTQETAHLMWRARENLVLGAGVDLYDRFGEHDVQVGADCVWGFHEGWNWATTIVYGPGAEVVAREVFDTELSRRLTPTLTGYLRWRHSWFVDDVHVDLFSPAVEIACGPNCSLTARYFLVDDSESGRGDTGALRVAIAPEQRLSGSLGIAYGNETFLTNTPNTAPGDADVLTLSAGVQWRASDRVHLRLDYDYEDHVSSYQKHGLALGLSLDF